MASSYTEKAEAFAGKVNNCNQALGDAQSIMVNVLSDIKIDVEKEDALALFTNIMGEEIELRLENIVKNNNLDVQSVKTVANSLDEERLRKLDEESTEENSDGSIEEGD